MKLIKQIICFIIIFIVWYGIIYYYKPLRDFDIFHGHPFLWGISITLLYILIPFILLKIYKRAKLENHRTSTLISFVMLIVTILIYLQAKRIADSQGNILKIQSSPIMSCDIQLSPDVDTTIHIANFHDNVSDRIFIANQGGALIEQPKVEWRVFCEIFSSSTEIIIPLERYYNLSPMIVSPYFTLYSTSQILFSPSNNNYRQSKKYMQIIQNNPDNLRRHCNFRIVRFIHISYKDRFNEPHQVTYSIHENPVIELLENDNDTNWVHLKTLYDDQTSKGAFFDLAIDPKDTTQNTKWPAIKEQLGFNK